MLTILLQMQNMARPNTPWCFSESCKTCMIIYKRRCFGVWFVSHDALLPVSWCHSFWLLKSFNVERFGLRLSSAKKFKQTYTLFRLIRQNVCSNPDQTGLTITPQRAALIRLVVWDESSTPPHPLLREFFSCTFVSQRFLCSKISCRVSNPSLTVTANSSLPGKQRK